MKKVNPKNEAAEYYIYKITLLCGSLQGHYYIGKHINRNRWDSYTGSGIVIKDYFKKYSAKNHITYEKEILCYCKDVEEMNSREAEFIGDLWYTDPLCINKMGGGGGGEMPKGKLNPLTGTHRSEEEKKHISEGNRGKKKSKEHCEHMSLARKGVPNPKCRKAVIATVIATGKEEYYSSMREAEEKTGASSHNISSCCRGRRGRKTLKGRQWRYADNEKYFDQ